MIKEFTYIYGLSCPKTGLIRYIGKSNDPKQRFSRHINEKNVTKKGSWIRSLINSGFIPNIEIIDKVPMCDWEFWEKSYIKLFKSFGANLLNMNEGGMSAMPSLETKLKQSRAKFGKIISLETREKIRMSNKGRIFPLHLKKKLSLERKGKPLHPNTNKARIEKCSIIVSSYDLFGKKIKTYNSISSASRDTGIAKHIICKICKKNPLYNKSKNITWRYGNENIITDISFRKTGKTSKIVCKYDLFGNFICEYKTMKIASENNNITVAGISAVCRGIRKTAMGFIWKYKHQQ
jgi:group I intron endonuclease